MKIRLRHERLAVYLARGKRSQNGWALRLGIHKGHLSRLANGKRPYPGAKTRQRLLEGLELPFEELFEVEVESVEGPAAAPDIGRLRRPWVQKFQTMAREEGIVRTLLQDLRFSHRVFRKNPALTLVALLTLALGIGSNTAIFSLVQAVLIEPIPYPEADRILFLGTRHPANGGRGAVSFEDFRSWQSASKWFSDLAVVTGEDVTLREDEGATRVSAEMISAGYFEVLGIPPSKGRTFLPEEADFPGGANDVVLLSHDYWLNSFGGEESVLGEELEIDGRIYKVIGVLPPGFRGIFESAQIWLPITAFDFLHPELRQYEILQSRGTRFLTGIARLAEGVSVDLSRQRMDELAVDLGRKFPRTNEGRGVVVDDAREELLGGFRQPILLLLGAVAAVLLIASTNLANLFLARSAGRTRELAIRNAVGASRSRLIRQVLTESVVLAVVGGALGVALAGAGLDLMLGLLPHTLPSFVRVEINTTVLAFALGLSVLTGLAFGTVPALRSVRTDLVSTLKQDERSLSRSPVRRFSGSLVTIEVALSLMLLIATGLMLKSFYRMQIFEPGFRTEGLISLNFNIPADRSDDQQQEQLLQELVQSIERLPGVESAALSSHIFFGGGYMTGDFYVEGREPATPDERLIGYRHYVGSGFFRVMGIPLLQGRVFSGQDRQESPQVVVISRGLAESFWPGEDPLGRRISFTKPSDSNISWRTVVGVVGDVQPRMRFSGAPWQIYQPVSQGGEWSRSVVIRASLPLASLAPPIRATARTLDPDIPIFNLSEVSDFLAQSAAPTGFLTTLLGLFGLLGLFLSAVGIYGVMSQTIIRRRSEIGIRMALGATRKDILRYFVRYGSLRAALGMVAGVLLSAWVVSLMSNQLYGVSPLDAGVFLLVMLFLGAVAMLSCLLPAWSAARQSPLETLRCK